MKQTETEQTEVDKAFERFVVWCKEREIPEDLPNKYMLMHDDGKYYQFKSCITRNYIFVNKVPSPFNM